MTFALLAIGLAFHPAVGSGEGAAQGLEVRLSADKPVYAPGERITLILQLVNRSNRAVILTFRDAQRFDVVLRDAQGREVWQWAAGRMFAQGLGRETLPPSGTLTYTVFVEQTLPPGVYSASGMITAREAMLAAHIVLRVEGH